MVCLQQLGLDVRLDRSAAKPWGFKLAGGAECNLPLTVVQVEPASPATRAGLADGDEVLRVNGRKSENLTRAAVHDIIASTPLRLELYVIRTIGRPQAALAPSPFEPEVPLRAESPFQRPVTPYRPFSTEPIPAIPPLEKPIILSPFYHDDFSKVDKPDFEPSTRFKLEKNKAYVPEDERTYPDAEKSYSAMLDEHATTIEELNKEIDLNQIETTAFEHRDYREDTIIEEVKIVKEMILREQILLNEGNSCNVNASLLTQLLDQTADEISKKSSEIEKKSVEIDKKTSEMDNKSTEYDNKSEVLITTKSSATSRTCEEETHAYETVAQNDTSSQENRQLSNQQKILNDDCEIPIHNQRISSLKNAHESIEEESKTAKDLIKSFEAKVEEDNAIRSRSIERKSSDTHKEDKNKSVKKELSKQHEEREESIKDRKHFEETTQTFNAIKHHTVSTANLLAEQRAYTLGLQTIPNIQGHAHSSYHYDLLLKTFFIHLTDVMVSLSRIILADGTSRSVTPMSQHTAQDTGRNVTRDVIKKTVEEVRTTSETVDEEKSEKSTEEKKKFAAKKAQMKSKDVTQKMEAVISEFKKDSHDEVRENNEKIESITENLNKERRNSVEITDETSGKIIYVATVEAKQIANLDGAVVDDEKKIVEQIAETAVKEGRNNLNVDVEQERKLSLEQSIMSKEKSDQIDKSFEENYIETHAKITRFEEGSLDVKREETHVEQNAQVTIDYQEIRPQFDARRLSRTVSPPKSLKVSTTDLACESYLSIQNIEHPEKSQRIEDITIEKTSTNQEIEIKSTSVTLRRLSDEIKVELEARRESQDSNKTAFITEPVRKMKSHSSTSSEDSWVPVPETPLTDEYVFRLQLPLEESKNPLPPSPPSEHEDPYTVKKSKLIPHIETNIESSKLYQDLREQRSKLNGTNGNSTKEADALPLTTCIAVSNIKSVELGTSETRQRTATLEESLQTICEQRNTTALSDFNREVEETGNYVKHNCGVTTQDHEIVTHHGGLIKQRKLSSYSNESQKTRDDTSDVGVICAAKKDVTLNTTHDKLNSSATLSNGIQKSNFKSQSGDEVTVCNAQQTSKSRDNDVQRVEAANHTAKDQAVTMEKYNCGIIAKSDGNVTHHGGLVRHTDNSVSSTATQSAVNTKHTEYSCEIADKAEGNVTHHGGLVQMQTVDQTIDQTQSFRITKTDQSAQQTTESCRQTLESSTRSMESTQSESHTRIDVHIESASEFAKNLVNLQKPYKAVHMVATVDMKETGAAMTQHDSMVSCHSVTSSLMKNGEVAQVVKRRSIQDSAQHGDAFFEGTMQGIVDALDDPVVADDEIAKQLGKPGLTEEKIAELMSGESEMLKEAHVIGLRRVIASHMHRHTDDDEDSVDFKKIKPQIDALRDSEVLKALNDELTKTKEEKKREERKWTTFLQRPERAPVKSKWDRDMTEREVYKIQIVKQPKPKVAPDYKPEDFETGPLPWEERAAREPPPPPVPREEPVLVPEPGPEYLQAVDDLPESQVPDLEHTDIPLPPEPKPHEEPVRPPFESELITESAEPENNQEPPHEELAEEAAAEDEMDKSQIAEHIVDSIQRMVDPKAPMEEQLSQMRAQLAALAELPGVISQTLQIVTAELGRLTDKEHSELKEGEVTVTEIKEGESLTEPPTPAVEEQPQPPALAEPGERAQQSDDTPAPHPPSPSPEPPAPFSVEQNEQQVTEECRIQHQKKELMAEMQFEHEQRQIKQRPTPRPAPPTPRPAFGPLVPQERPIVLPGGRRWRGPRDAVNEDFIRETLTAQAEVIQGKAKGINFLKWEKPVRTLEHLKDSSVYKLLHHLDDSPAKQVECLPPVALAESEYRERCRSVTPLV